MIRTDRLQAALSEHAFAQVVYQVDLGDQTIKVLVVRNNGNLVLFEQGNYCIDAGIWRHLHQVGYHYRGNFHLEVVFVFVDAEQNIGFIDQADDIAIIDNR